MALRIALYTMAAGGRAVYHRAGIPFPDGQPVTLDPEKVGQHGMAAIEADPRLKVSEAPKKAVEAAAGKTPPAETIPDGGPDAFKARVVEAIGKLQGDDFRKDGVPKVPAVRAVLAEADHPHLSGDYIEAVWAEIKPPA